MNISIIKFKILFFNTLVTEETFKNTWLVLLLIGPKKYQSIMLRKLGSVSSVLYVNMVNVPRNFVFLTVFPFAEPCHA